MDPGCLTTVHSYLGRADLVFRMLAHDFDLFPLEALYASSDFN